MTFNRMQSTFPVYVADHDATQVCFKFRFDLNMNGVERLRDKMRSWQYARLDKAVEGEQ
jgi:hypothetical protein